MEGYSVLGSYLHSTLVTCGFTSVMSILYLVLVFRIFILRYKCYDETYYSKPSDYTMLVLYRQYIADPSCPGLERVYEGSSYTKFFKLLYVTIISSLAMLLFSLILTMTTLSKDIKRTVMSANVFTAVYFSCMFVDWIVASHFLGDYRTITDLMNKGNPGQDNYPLDMIRYGTLIAALVALKGIVYHLINLVLMFSSHATKKEYVRRRWAIARNRRSLVTAGQGEGGGRAALRYISVEDLPRLRRLQAMRTRRARNTTPGEIPLRQVTSTNNVPRPMNTVPSRIARHAMCCACTCTARRPRRKPAPNHPLPRASTTAFVETQDMAIAGPPTSGTDTRSRFAATSV